MHTPATASIRWLSQPTIIDSAAMMLSTAIFWRLTGWPLLGRRPMAFCVFALVFAFGGMSINLIIAKALHYPAAKALWVLMLGAVWLYQVYAMVRKDLFEHALIKKQE